MIYLIHQEDKEKSLKPFGVDRGGPFNLRGLLKLATVESEGTSSLYKTSSEVKERDIILAVSTRSVRVEASKISPKKSKIHLTSGSNCVKIVSSREES